MLILRMLSGLLAGVWGLLGGRRRELAASPPQDFHPELAIPMAISSVCCRAESFGEDKDDLDDRVWAAEWHAAAARKAVMNLDGEGILKHMRHFRRYSYSARQSSSTIGYPPGVCGECGGTAADRDMVSGETAHRRLVCIPCSGHRDRPMWSARNGDRVPVAEMGDTYLINSARMVRRWLREAKRPVNDDRIRMCGHVLEECDRRGLLPEVKRD